MYLRAGCGIVYYFLLFETFSSLNHFFFDWFSLIPLPSKHRKLFPIIIHFRHLIYSHGLKFQLYMETGGGDGNPLQYSCLGNPMNRRAWWATIHGVARVGHDSAAKPPHVGKISPPRHLTGIYNPSCLKLPSFFLPHDSNSFLFCGYSVQTP